VRADTVEDFDQDGTGTPWTTLNVGPEPPCPPQLIAGGPTGEGRSLRVAHGRRTAADCEPAELPPPDVPPPDVNANSVAFDRTDPGEFDVVVADFDLRLAPATGRADGFGFALLATGVWGISGGVGNPAAPFVAEEPNFDASLGIGFDIFQSTDIDDVNDNHVSIHFDEARLAEFSADEVFDLGGAQWFHVRVLVHLGASEVSVVVTPCNGEPVVLVDSFPVPGLAPYESRAYFAARSGGSTSDQDLDNVRIRYLDDEPEVFSFSAHRYEAFENGPAVALTVQRSGDGVGSASVGFATESLTASSGSDYSPAAGTLVFADGETTQSFTVELQDDDLNEVDEVFRVVLQNPSSGASLGGPVEATVSIADDETARVQGHFSLVCCWPIVPIHLHLLPTGKVLAWGRKGTGAPGGPGGEFDRIRLWDPVTRELTTPALPPHDVFCSGHSFLADGRLLVAGGNIADGTGLPDVVTYDPFAGTWSDDDDPPDMNAGRWYATTVVLADGNVAVESGEIVPGFFNELPQVLGVRAKAWRDLSVAEVERPPIADLYPRLLLAPDGRLFKAGPDRDSWFLDTSGTGHWIEGPLSSPLVEPLGSDPNRARTYGAAVMFDGEVLLIGGADPPTASVNRIDLDQVDPTWRSVGSLHLPRRHLNATLLPDGRVLVTGGTSSPGFNDGAEAVRIAEIWNPQSETWSTLASMKTKRVYHSTAVLLPDGRVLVAGGGQPNAEGDADHRDVEIFSPPYVFNGPRPTISSAPDEVAYGDLIEVLTPDAASIAKATLIRLGSTTHAFDQNQRLVTLVVSPIAGGLSLQLPESPRAVPPGHYMLFLVDDRGTPSVAHMLKMGFGPLFSDGFETGDTSAWSDTVP
jgi:hypothetical protein